MPTLEQLPAAIVANPADILMIDQSGVSKSVAVATLTTGLQPSLTLAPNTLLGRVGLGPGQPQPVNLGNGVALANGALAVDTTLIAPLASPSFTGTPTAPTPVVSDSSTQLATTAFVQARCALPVNALSTNVSTSVVQAIGGTQPATTSARSALKLDAVLDFGADPTGDADSTAALQAGITALQSAGGGVLRLAGSFKISSTLTITRSHIGLIGLGCGQLHGDLSWDAPSRLVWAGSAGGTMLSVAPLANTTSGKALIDSEVSDILFDCHSLAATGVVLSSVRHGRFRLGYLNPAIGTQLQAGVVFDTVDLAEYNDTQYNTVSIVGAELGSGGQGVLLQAKSRNCMANGVRYYGNTSYNVFNVVDLHYWRGVPLTLRETDNNIFENWNINAPPAIPPAFPTPAYATAYSIEIQGSSDSSWPFPAISNVFVHGGCAGPIMCRGTPSYTVASGAGTPVNPNLFLQLDKGNGVPDPTIEAGASAYFGDLYFIDNGKGLTQASFSDTRAGIEALRLKLASANALGGAVFHSSTGAAARLFSSDLSQSWTATPGIDASLSLTPATQSNAALLIGQAGRPQVKISGANTGSPVSIAATSNASANASLALTAQGAGSITAATANGIQFQVTDSGAPAANMLSVRGSASGASPYVQATGSDSNIDLTLAGQGAGLIRGVTPPLSDASTALATTSWVQSKNYLISTSTSFSIAGGMIANAAQPANAAVDVIAPLNGATYIDNVLSLQNNSVNASGLSGNAAIRFRASTAQGGYERAAIGYSGPASTAFYPHLLYAEIGNIAATTDANDTDFSVVNTHAAGAVHLPGTGYQAFTVQGSTGNISFTGPTGQSLAWNAGTGMLGNTGLQSLSNATALSLGTPQGAVLKLNDPYGPVLSSLNITGGNGGNPVVMAVVGETNQGYSIRSAGAGQINLQSASGANQLTVLPNATAVNALSVQGGSTGSNVILAVNGTDPNCTIQIQPQGTGQVYMPKVGIWGGSIDQTVIGGTTPTIGTFTAIKTGPSTAYTASGAIAITDGVSTISSTSNLSMTLAAGAVDGHEIIVKRLGAGTVSLTANIDGTLGATAMPALGALRLRWSAALSTYLSL